MYASASQFPTELEDKLAARFELGKYVTVGVDPNKKMLLDRGNDNELNLRSLTMDIIEAIIEEAGAIKFNKAFFERMGSKGYAVLEEAVNHVRHRGKGIPIILDAKYNDIDNSADAYAEFPFEVLRVDGVTWNPYLGLKASEKVFARYPRKYFAVLCRTSNPGAEEIQNLVLYLRGNGDVLDDTDTMLYESIGELVSREWPDNCGLVYGATVADDLEKFRVERLRSEDFLLLPGVGEQNGDLENSVRYGQNSAGLFLLNVGRAIIAPKPEKYEEGERYTDVVARKAREYNALIAAALQEVA